MSFCYVIEYYSTNTLNTLPLTVTPSQLSCTLEFPLAIPIILHLFTTALFLSPNGPNSPNSSTI